MPQARTRKSKPEPAAKVRKREQEVLDAAAQVFYDRGYADATVQDVADALGILKGSLYYYIRTKEDLLFRLLEQVHDEVDKLLDEIAKDREGTPPLERLEEYVRRQAEHSMRNLVPITVYYHDIERLSDERQRTILDRRKAHEGFVLELIEQAQASGAVDPKQDSRMLCNCVFGSIIWTYRWYRPRGRVNVTDAAALCASYAIGGVTGAPRPAAAG
jgi:TetR/AcrR family transcriptional regulator, cholesterol catabolism regulator